MDLPPAVVSGGQGKSVNYAPHRTPTATAENLPAVLLPISIVLITFAKILLIPSYRSTDFDVHRNWLALTRNLPLSRWYFDDAEGRTVHTLDYPPGFAFFEYALSSNPFTNWLLENGAVDERCFEILGDEENEPSRECVLFQRTTVIVCDAVYVFGAIFAAGCVMGLNYWGERRSREASEPIGPASANERTLVVSMLLVLNSGLLLLDHVHFQYNGAMLGLLLFSIGFLARGSDGNNNGWDDVIGAMFYAGLLAMKHLYITLGPLYFIYLLRHYCFVIPASGDGSSQFSLKRLLTLGFCTLATLLLPFLPFLLPPIDASEQLKQMILRLFPFQRGLCHEYWAGNVWALYLFGDKCLTFAAKVFGMRGLVREEDEAPFVLPDVSPGKTAFCLALGLIPGLICAWNAASSMLSMGSRSGGVAAEDTYAMGAAHRRTFFVRAVAFCSFSGFMLSYHAHEKAIMTAVIPLTLISTHSREDARLYLRTSSLGHFGLLPLLYRPEELPFKVVSYCSFLALSVFLLEFVTISRREDGARQGEGLVTRWDVMGMTLLAISSFFMEVAHPLFFKPRGQMEFLPLMVTSVIVASGLAVCWVWSGVLLWRNGCRLLEAPQGLDNEKRKLQ